MSAADRTVPVSILTGFLGAGKTTLLNRLLKHPELTDTAVIINEFGEVGIDHLLVEQSGDGVIELADGCLCCTVRGELVDTLADLMDRMQTGKIRPLQRVVIETTGLADPAPVIQAVIGNPVLAHSFRLDGVITLVDAVNGLATLAAHPESVKQVAVADRLVLTKTAMTDGVALSALTQALSDLNPRAAVIDAHHLAFGLGLHEAAGGHGFEVRLARHEMHVVLRKQDNLTGLHLARWTVADRNEHRAFGDEVIGDDVRGLPMNCRQSSEVTLARTHHGAVNSAARKTAPVTRTSPRFQVTDFWAEGITLGIDIRY